MVVGDVVIGLSASNTDLQFQPAAGVEVVVTIVGILINKVSFVNASDSSQRVAAVDVNNSNMKMFITNVLWLFIQAQGVGLFSGFSGMQTQ